MSGLAVSLFVRHYIIQQMTILCWLSGCTDSLARLCLEEKKLLLCMHLRTFSKSCIVLNSNVV